MGERDSGDVNQLESVARVLMRVKKCVDVDQWQGNKGK